MRSRQEYLEPMSKREKLFSHLFTALSDIGEKVDEESNELRAMVLAMIDKMKKDTEYGAGASWDEIDALAGDLQNSSLMAPFKGAQYDESSHKAAINAVKDCDDRHLDEVKKNRDQFRSTATSSGLGLLLAVAVVLLVLFAPVGLIAMIPLGLAGAVGAIWSGHKFGELEVINHDYARLETDKEGAFHRALGAIAAQPQSFTSSTGRLVEQLGGPVQESSGDHAAPEDAAAPAGVNTTDGAKPTADDRHDLDEGGRTPGL